MIKTPNPSRLDRSAKLYLAERRMKPVRPTIARSHFTIPENRRSTRWNRRAFSREPSVLYIMGKITVVTNVTPPIQLSSPMTWMMRRIVRNTVPPIIMRERRAQPESGSHYFTKLAGFQDVSREGAHRCLQPDRHVPFPEIFLGLPDGVFAEVEDRGRERGVRLAPGQSLIDVFEISHAARGNNGDRNGLGHGPREGKVVTVLPAVLVHAREQYLSRSVLLHHSCPCHSVYTHGLSAAVGVDLPFEFGVPPIETFEGGLRSEFGVAEE